MTNWRLDENEDILWQSRPHGDLHFGIETYVTAIFGLVVIAVCIGIGWILDDTDAIIQKLGPPDTVFFAPKKVWNKEGQFRRASHVDIGFLRIDDGGTLFAMMMIQGAARTNPRTNPRANQGRNDT